MNSSHSLSLSPHHDGSELYLSSLSPKIGETVLFRFRAPIDYRIDEAILRAHIDGEPRFFKMARTIAAGEQWWSGKIEIINKITHYRFLILNGNRYTWLNAEGLHNNDVTSGHDFQLLAIRKFPDWIRSSVFYQIFPDRFASTGQYRELKPQDFVSRDWNQIPRGRHKTTGIEYFGGDLDGVREHINHIINLGANGIYFTPFFPARSTHRYDASSFDEVDPLLGGDDALLRLKRVSDKAGISLMGDLTTNHCGAGHPWIKKALTSKGNREREFFYWDKKSKHGYEGWWGLASLPKLNYNSSYLVDLMYKGKNSIVKKWLKKPFKLSGWRIDVGNMTGIYRDDDIHDAVVRGVREALDEVNPDAWLVAENADHFPKDLDGFGWHGTMNYTGFMRPVWGWLAKDPDIENGFFGVPTPVPSFTGAEMARTMQEFAGSIPWRCFVSSMLLLDSHDTARFRNVVGKSKARHLVGMGLLLTYPGVPSIFAGDEIGLEGAWGEDSRRTIDWTESNWDHELFSEVKKIVSIRRTSHALSNGGMRWVLIQNDAIGYLRESGQDRILVIAARAKCRVKMGDFVAGAQVLYGPTLRGNSFQSKGPAIGIYRLPSLSQNRIGSSI
jgi:alpha-glucosidase